MSNERRLNLKTQRLVITALLTALIFVMSFTPIGYLKVGIVSITLIPIPVVIGAILCGPAYGALLGLVFGITSLIQCFGMDVFGTTLMSINPAFTVILCLIPRVIMGLFSGLIYKTLSGRLKRRLNSYAIASFSGGFLNTALFVGALVLLFGSSDYIRSFGDGIIEIIGALVTVNAVVEWIACLFIGTAVSTALSKAIKE